MKSLSTAALVLCLIGAGLSWAQNAAPGSRRHGPRLGPNANQVNFRVRGQLKLVHDQLETGKIDSQDADTLKSSLKDIRDQETAFLKANGTNDLTQDQATQLNQLLDQNSAKWGGPVGSMATPSPSNVP